MAADPWEAVRHMTLDQLVTYTKLNGSAFALRGFTTPEGYRFTILLAVGSPGNERGVNFITEVEKRFAREASWGTGATNPNLTESP